MSTQPLSEIAPTPNTVSKSIEIATTGKEMDPIGIQKFALLNPKLTIHKPLNMRYDPYILLSNWYLYSTVDLNSFDSMDLSHDKILFNALPTSSMLNYFQYSRCDLEIMCKIVSNVQQVGAVRFSLIPPVSNSDSARFLEPFYFPFTYSSVSWKIVPFGMNSEHTFVIPWNSTIPYWRQRVDQAQLHHGKLRILPFMKQPIESVVYKPTMQIFIRYTNVETAGLFLNE